LGFADPAFTLGVGVSGVKTIELVAREMGVAHAPTVITWGAAGVTK
jgi:hypothetical protein